MLALDRNAFVCDMAETYRIYDIKSIPLQMLAVLASGLGINSRIRLRQEGLKASWDIVLLAKIVDLLTDEDSKSITQVFMIEDKEKKRSEFQTFDSIEDFERAKAAIIASNPIEEEVTYGGN